MPFTPFHMGPALAVGLPLKRFIHVPTFALGNVVLDVEPLVVLVYGLDYPLHGYLHTLVGALVVGLALGRLMYGLEGAFSPLWRALLLEVGPPRLGPFLAGGVAGAVLHVLLDSPLYSDIRPLYPAQVNPLYSPGLTSAVYMACTVLGVAGAMYYLVLASALLRGARLLH